jgi:NAD+ synthase
MAFTRDALALNVPAEVDRLCEFIRDQVRFMKREGAVIGLSGGIDSAVCSSLCVRALGKDRVFGLILPERESSPVSREYAEDHARKLGIAYEVVSIDPVLDAFGTYKKRDEAIREQIPDYDSRYRIKLALPGNLLEKDTFNVFSLKMDDGSGNVRSARLSLKTLHAVMAASNTKQRVRMLHLYYQAEKRHYLVCGTTNRSETQQGFFVKYGDGGVDIEPIAHLYKTHVFQLASFLDVPRTIRERAPSPDTYSFEVTDEEFYFRMPYDVLDLLLYAWEHGIDPGETAEAMDLTADQVKRAFRDIAVKYEITRHLRDLPPSLPVELPGGGKAES